MTLERPRSENLVQHHQEFSNPFREPVSHTYLVESLKAYGQYRKHIHNPWAILFSFTISPLCHCPFPFISILVIFLKGGKYLSSQKAELYIFSFKNVHQEQLGGSFLKEISNLIFCAYGRSVNTLGFFIFLKVDKNLGCSP